MDLATLTRVGTRHLRTTAAEALYLRSGIDATRPVSIRGMVNERCNYKCRYCDFWRLAHYQDELEIEEWQAALLSLKEFVGRYAIQFSGGEPFLKKGFLDLLEFCRDAGIAAGVITNGAAFNVSTVERFVRARPLNVDLSVDSADPAVHDAVRGVDGSLARITAGIRRLRAAQTRLGVTFPLRIKPTVHAANFRTLPRLVDWAVRQGATCVDFKPVIEQTREVGEELWIRGAHDLSELRRVADRLIEMKRRGAPIETPVEALSGLAAHFEGHPGRPAVAPCRVGMRDYHIRPNGDVQVCWFHPAIGNVRDGSARDIWLGEKARAVRASTVRCSRFGTPSCASSCLAHKPLREELKRGLMLLKAGQRRPA